MAVVGSGYYCKSWNLLLPSSYVEEDGTKEVGEVDDAKKGTNSEAK